MDTETREIVSDVTDGNEQLSVVRYSPGGLRPHPGPRPIPGPSLSEVTVFVDGLYLAIGSHDNMIYIYSVSSDGAKSSRFGRCVVRKLGWRVGHCHSR